MNRIGSALRWMLVLALLVGMCATRCAAAPTITGAAVYAVRMSDGSEAGTEKTWFVFRAYVTPSSGQSLWVPPGVSDPYRDPGSTTDITPAPNVPYVYIRLVDTGTPANGAVRRVAMRRDYQAGGGYNFVAFVRGSVIAAAAGVNITSGGRGTAATGVSWAIVANETGTQPQTAASGVGYLSVYPSTYDTQAQSPAITIVPVTPDGADDKAPGTGQLGNGLRTNPEDSTSPNDGGGATQYIWRVRVSTLSGLPPSVWTTAYPLADYTTQARFAYVQSGVMLVLTGPGSEGEVKYCPMEIEPNQAVSATTIYPNDGTLQHPQGRSAYGSGVLYRYTMLPTEYTIAPFGGDLQDMVPLFTSPDGLPSQYQGRLNSAVITGRPYANVYAAFGQLDALLYFALFMSPPPPMPYYTQAQSRVGEYRYYYMTSMDFRPDTTPWSGADGLNFVVTGWNPADPSSGVTQYYENYSATPTVYSRLADTDDPMGYPGDTSWANQYKHPYVTPILSDGHWTDDLLENQKLQLSPSYAGESVPPYSATTAVSSNARRSRATTQTRVRFQVRVYHTLPSGGQTPITVRLWLGTSTDGTMTAHTMNVEPNQGTIDYTQGVVYYYDTSFPKGQEGFKAFYFDADDGNHRAIWPRRPIASMDPWSRFEDVQATGLPARSESVLFGQTTVGKNYTLEPWVNSKPVLSNPSVSPTSGVEGGQYTYSVTYTDADNDLPIDAWVILDNDPVNRRYRMTRDTSTASNSASQGIRYQLVLSQLPASLTQKHNYYFQFRDNWAAQAPIRREYGEWVTLPQGDDNGNPSGWIDGPTIVGNRLPGLSNPSFSASDQANNTATRYDFFVTYTDADNDAPAYVKAYIDLYETATNNIVSAVPDTGTNLVRVNSTTANYVVGEQYHLPSTVRLAAPGAGQEYRYRFQSSDGKGAVAGVGPEVTELQVGDGSTALGLGTARTLTRSVDSPPTYVDTNNTRLWNTDATTLYVWVNGTAAASGNYSIDALQRALVFTSAADPGTSGVVKVSYRHQQVVGPPVVADAAPVLSPTADGLTQPDLNYLTCTPLQGDPTTSFVFTAVYTDADNQAPTMADPTSGATVSAVKLVINGGGTYAMPIHPDDAKLVAIDYRKGVRYTTTVTLPVGKYTYHFEANDGALEGRFPLTTATPTELPGPNVEDIGALSSATIEPFPKGSSSQIYQFKVTYKNSSGLPPSVPIELHVWDSAGTSSTTVPMVLVSSPPDYKTGAVYQNSRLLNGLQTATAEQPLSWGTHRITFGFQDREYSVPTVPADQMLTVNAPPVLSDPTPTQYVTPNPAPRSSTVTFAVKYSDLNGDPPVDATTKAASIKLYVADSAGTYVEITGATLSPAPSTFPEFPATTSQKIIDGQVFTWSMLAKNLPDSTVTGTRNVKFTAVDDFGEAATDLVVTGGLTIGEGGLPSLQGPTVGVGTNDGTVSPAIGTTATSYVYSVIYRHDLNLAPDALTLTLYEGATAVKTVALADFTKVGTDYSAGVQYTYTSTGLFNPGNHTYAFQVTQGSNNAPLPASGTYAGPYVNYAPTLGTAQVVVTAGGVPGSPATVDGTTGFLVPETSGSVKNTYTFRVTYTDADGAITPPSYVKMMSSTNTELNNIVLTPPSGTLDYAAGVVYTSAALTLTAGEKTFHFVAADKSSSDSAAVVLDTVRFPSAVEASKLTVNGAIQLSGPTPSDTVRFGTLAPISGSVSTNYTFSIVYTHEDGTLPSTLNAIVWDATGTSVVGTFAMSAVSPANPTDTQIKLGVTYGVTVPGSSIGGGAHKYSFFASDGSTTTQLPLGTSRFDGPTINYAPTLSLPTAYVYSASTPDGPTSPSYPNASNVLTPAVAGSIQSQYVFRVSYSDADLVAPTSSGYVRVVISDVSNPVTLTAKSTTPDYTGAVVFESAPITLTAGAKTFYFEASDGSDTTRMPTTAEISGLTVRSTLVLSAPTAGTLTPVSGPLSTSFTYQVLYQNADNTAPSSVKLIIDGDATNALTMTKVGTSTDYATGVVYTYTYRFPSTTTARDHTYRFTAVDSLTADYTGYFPGPTATETLSGPLLNTASFTTTPSPLAEGTVGSTYTVAGTLVTDPALITSDNRAVRLQMIRPDGTGFSEDLTVNIDGSFTYTTTAALDQTGDWIARLIWDGVTGKFDSLTKDFTFKATLTGLNIGVGAGQLAMISSPLIPTNADPNSIYHPLDGSGTALPVTVLDMQAWVTSSYLSYNLDAGFPRVTTGMGVWVRPTQAVTLSPQGKVADSTSSYSISVPAGWSIIGPVSLQALAWNTMKVRYQGVEMSLTDGKSPLRNYAWTYDATATGTYKPYKLIQGTAVLNPGQGYWVRATAACELVLPAHSRAAVATRAADLTASQLQVVARTKTAIDTDNFILLDSSARSRAETIEKPPYLGEYVSVQMLPAGTVTVTEGSRAVDTKDVVGFEIASNQPNTDVTVSFPNIAVLGRRYKVTAVDIASGTRRSINSAGTLTYNTGDNSSARRFALIITPATQNARLVISAVRAASRASGGVSMSYTISSDATVQVEVQSITGATVRTLNQSRAATAGSNSVLWDGRNGSGAAMPAGNYVLRLRATDADGNSATYSQPVVLIR